MSSLQTYIHSVDQGGKFLKTKGGTCALVKGLGNVEGEKKGADYLKYRIHLVTQSSTMYINPNAAQVQLKKIAVGANYVVKDGDLVFIKVKRGRPSLRYKVCLTYPRLPYNDTMVQPFLLHSTVTLPSYNTQLTLPLPTTLHPKNKWESKTSTYLWYMPQFASPPKTLNVTFNAIPPGGLLGLSMRTTGCKGVACVGVAEVGDVTKGGKALKVGVRKHDMIAFVNGRDVTKLTHKQMTLRLKNATFPLTLTLRREDTDLWFVEPTPSTKYTAVVGPLLNNVTGTSKEGEHAESRAKFKVHYTMLRLKGVETQYFRLELISTHTPFMEKFVYLYVKEDDVL